MKKLLSISSLIFTFSILTIMLSCKSDCEGEGYLKLTNNSNNTVQRMMIDGINYGSLDPGESESISLPAGEHEFQLVGISGGAGCSPAKVIIVECETQGFSCSN
ncbi:MAG TPA: hypothetical protein PK081_09200 [Bacteroidales bacterium]|nr:hypothetical protein [Bacteroidales bacterium]